MSDVQVSGEAAPVETTTTPPAEAGFSSAESTVTTRDFETEAKDMGWVPEAEFRGPKEKWKPAQQFVEDGENILPIVRAENKRLKEKLDQLDKDYATRFDRLDRASQATIKAAKANFDRELERLTAQREAAVKAGDVTAFNAIDKKITDHAANAPKVEDFEKPPASKSDDATVEKEWIARNSWYEANEDMRAYAFFVSNQIKRPDLSLEENLRMTEAAVKAKYPLQFAGKSGANAHAPVDGGGDPKGSSRGSDTLTSKLPAEALAFAKQAVKDGTYKSTEEWARVYFEK